MGFQCKRHYLRNDIAGQRTGDVNTTINNVFTSFPSDGERSYTRYNYTVRSSVTFTPNARDAFSAGFYTGFRSQSRRADIVYNNTKTDLTTGDILGRITYFNSNIARKSGQITLGNLDYTHTFDNKSALALSGLIENAGMDGLTTNLNLAEPGRKEILQSSRNPSENPLNAFRLRADYTINVGQGKLEAGYQYRNQVQKGISNTWIWTWKAGHLLSCRSSAVRQEWSTTYILFIANIRQNRESWNTSEDCATNMLPAHLRQAARLPGTSTCPIFFPTLNLQYQLTNTFRAKAGYSKRVQRATTSEPKPISRT